MWSNEARSVWVDTDSQTLGWFRIAEGLSQVEAQRIAGQLSVPARITPSNATGREIAKMLYPEEMAEVAAMGARWDWYPGALAKFRARYAPTQPKQEE